MRPHTFAAVSLWFVCLGACTSHTPSEQSAGTQASATNTSEPPAPSVVASNPPSAPLSAAPHVPVRSVQEGLSLGGRSALIEGPASVPSSHAPRAIAHGIGIEEGPVSLAAPRNVKVVSPGKVQDATITGTYAMLLIAENGAPAQWLQMLLVEGLAAPPPPSFFGVHGASSVTWKDPIPSPSRELVSCISFEGIDPLVEVHGNKEARFVVGRRYVGASAFTDVTGAFVVDSDVYLWLTRDGRAELVDLAASVTRRAPDAPKRLEPVAGKPRCPMR